MIEFRMPLLEVGMEAGTLVEWFKQPGDQVRRGDIIALVATQRGPIEIEASDEGVIGEQRVQPGRKVPVGTVLATIFGVQDAATVRRSAKPNRTKDKRPYGRRGSARDALVAPARRAQRTPMARRHAIARCISTRQIPPGNGGGIAEAPHRYREDTSPEAMKRRDWSALDLDEMREAIGAAMVQSHRDIPHYWVAQAIDVTPLFGWLEEQNALRPPERKLLYVAPLMKAVALALSQVPELNGHYEDGVFRPAKAVHMGLATSLHGGGQIAPAIRDADSRSVDELMGAIADLLPRARQGRLQNSEMTDGTVTVSHLGEGKADSVFPLIYPPQVAIVGCGTASPRPWVVGDAVTARLVIEVTVAGDHRVSHGRHAARFLADLSKLVSQPEAL